MTDLNSISIAIVDEPKLPTIDLGVVHQVDGYSCGWVITYLEQISRGSQDLITNRPEEGSPAWSAAFVDRYMKANHISGQPHYPCLSIAEAVHEGSLETVSTTSIKRSMIE